MTVRFRDWDAERMKDPAYRAAVEELEYVYQLTRLRLLKGWTQQQLAERVGTSQSAIARLENGNASPTLRFVRRVANALGARVVIRIEPGAGAPVDVPGQHAE